MPSKNVNTSIEPECKALPASNMSPDDELVVRMVRPFGDEGFSLVETTEEGKEEPVLEILSEVVFRAGSGWNREEAIEHIAEPVHFDNLDELALRGIEVGLSPEYLRDTLTDVGDDLPMVVALLRKEIEALEIDCLVDVSRATHCFDIETMPDRVENYAVANALKKSDEDYFLNLWREAVEVLIEVHDSGFTEITIKDAKRHQFTMSTSDFAELMVISSVNGGKSMVYVPVTGDSRLYKSLFMKLRLFGHFLGDGNMPKFIVEVDESGDAIFIRDLQEESKYQMKLWQDGLTIPA